jgi:5-methylcytosine-specific restriction endonuclease McrA
MKMEVLPSSKRLTACVHDEIFKTQKSLIDRVKPMLDEFEIIKPNNQQFILEFVKSYDKVLYRNKEIKRVYFGPNDCIPSHFKHSKCLHVVFADASEITVSYKNVVAALFNPEIAYQRRQRENKLQYYRSLISQDIFNFKDSQLPFGCKVCKCSFEYNKPNVDHCGDMEFRHLVKSYETEGGTDFLQFHRENAELQLLCEPCHKSKSKSW